MFVCKGVGGSDLTTKQSFKLGRSTPKWDCQHYSSRRVSACSHFWREGAATSWYRHSLVVEQLPHLWGSWTVSTLWRVLKWMSGIFMLYQNLAHEPSYAGGGGHCFSKFPQLRSVLRQSVCWFVVYLLHWKKPAGSRISGIDRCVATWIGKMVKELMARPTKAESDRFSGCGIKPRGSGAGEIVPAGRDRGRRDKAHSNSLLDAH